MFTGIVEAMGEVVHKTDTGLTVRAAFADGGAPAVSDSVSVNGACLTVTALEGGEVVDDGYGLRLFHCGVSCRAVCRNSSACLAFYLDAIVLVIVPETVGEK